MKISEDGLKEIIEEEIQAFLDEDGHQCQPGYKTHPKRKTKKMFGKTYRNCVKAEQKEKDGWYEPHIWPDDNKWPGGSKVKQDQANKKKSNRKRIKVPESNLEDIIREEILNYLEEKKKKRKLTAKPSSETSLRDWFGRKGAKGKKGGWVDCNTCRKDKKTGRKKCKSCGRSAGEKRAKYPSCRPTPGACGKRGKYGKKSKAGKKG